MDHHLPRHRNGSRLQPAPSALAAALAAALMFTAPAAPPIGPGELRPPRIEVSGQLVELTHEPTVVGRGYQFQETDSLATGAWVDLGAGLAGTGGSLGITVPRDPCTIRKFYRLALVRETPVPAGFVRIPAAWFTMGDTQDGDLDAPPVKVHVGEFYMGAREVTMAQWEVVRKWGVDHGYSDIAPGAGKGLNHPVVSVSWWDVVKWCNARSEMDGLTPVYYLPRFPTWEVMRTGTADPAIQWNAGGYRLPTEAEWEKAARGGATGLRFPWGDTINHDHANYLANGDAIPYDTSPYAEWTYHPDHDDGSWPYSAPAGSFAPNSHGLYDMAGNVWEWCGDWYSASTYTADATDPKGPATGSTRVFRGGAWGGNAGACRVAGRFSFVPGDTSLNLGFRLARSAAIPAGFTRIPAGWFTMGDTLDGEPDAPPVNVHLNEFFMAKHEVTKAQWDEVAGWAAGNGYTDLTPGDGKGMSHPVGSVSWWDAVKWCNARSEMEGLAPVYYLPAPPKGRVMRTGTMEPVAIREAEGYRLPTEAEWEKAARGGAAGLRFPWGDTITHSHANYYSRDWFDYDISPTRGFHPAYDDGTLPYTSPVGSFLPNGYGLHDVAGNVWEWCWDWYSESAYTDGASDPQGPAAGSFRVLRGSNWGYYANGCRVAGRSSGPAAGTHRTLGFRPVRTPLPLP